MPRPLLEPAPQPLADSYGRWGLTRDESMAAMLNRSAARWPDLPAVVDVVDGAREVSYGAALDEVRRLAAFLRRQGIGPGDVVLVQAPNSRQVVFACWAAWQIGAICNPVVDIYREHEMRHIVGAARPDAVVTVAEHRGHDYPAMFDTLLGDAAPATKACVVIGGEHPGWTSYDEAIANDGLDGAPELVHPDEPALILFTSGTTSLPKGAVHTSRTLLAETYQMADGWSFGWMDRMHLPLPIAHITGVLFGLTVPVAKGGCAVVSRVTDLETLVDEIVEHRITTTAGTPVIFTALGAAYERAGITRIPLKVMASGGSNVAPVLVAEGEKLGIRPCRIYGMTEMPTVTMPCPADTPRQRLETDGRLAPGVECEAVDPETRAPLALGEEGELRVRGPERMIGYLDPDQTAEQIDGNGWLYTGDLGRIDDEGCVTITGRIKDIINRGGEKFSARDIEDALVGHPDVAAVAIVAGPDRRFGEVPAAFLVAAPGSAPLPESELAAFLAERGVARQKTPVHWRWVEELPVNASGKVKKFELVAQLREEPLS